MAETKQIAEIAGRISNEIFSVFGWTRSERPEDVNFPCDRIERHHRATSKTHPVDCVFRYRDPYDNQPLYFLVDLKSYSSGTITKQKIGPAIRSMASSVECAQTSKAWKDRYVEQGDSSFRVHGLLFVYNHDGEYDKSFAGTQIDVLPDSLNLPGASRLYVFGPADINYAEAVVNDFLRARAELKLPGQDSIKAVHPDQETRFSPRTESSTTQIEDLLGPFMIFSIDTVEGGSAIKNYLIYSKSQGDSDEEFEFLLDHLFRNDFVLPNSRIEIRGPFFLPDAALYLNNAKKKFLARVYNLKQFEERLDQIQIKQIKLIRTEFSDTQIGMERR